MNGNLTQTKNLRTKHNAPTYPQSQWKVLVLNVETIGFKTKGSSHRIKYNHTRKFERHIFI